MGLKLESSGTGWNVVSYPALIPRPIHESQVGSGYEITWNLGHGRLAVFLAGLRPFTLTIPL